MFQALDEPDGGEWGSSFVIQSASRTISKNLSSSCKSVARIQSALEIRPRKPPSATVVKASTGGAFQRLHPRQAEALAVAVERLLHQPTLASSPAASRRERSLPLIGSGRSPVRGG